MRDWICKYGRPATGHALMHHTTPRNAAPHLLAALPPLSPHPSPPPPPHPPPPPPATAAGVVHQGRGGGAPLPGPRVPTGGRRAAAQRRPAHHRPAAPAAPGHQKGAELGGWRGGVGWGHGVAGARGSVFTQCSAAQGGRAAPPFRHPWRLFQSRPGRMSNDCHPPPARLPPIPPLRCRR